MVKKKWNKENLWNQKEASAIFFFENCLPNPIGLGFVLEIILDGKISSANYPSTVTLSLPKFTPRQNNLFGIKRKRVGFEIQIEIIHN